MAIAEDVGAEFQEYIRIYCNLKKIRTGELS
jgi:hypothetical protein